MNTKECMFKPICPTTNYWVEEKKDFIVSTCNTNCHKLCTSFEALTRQRLTPDSTEWQRILKYYEERKKQFPPYGIIKNE